MSIGYSTYLGSANQIGLRRVTTTDCPISYYTKRGWTGPMSMSQIGTLNSADDAGLDQGNA
jgi:hypothetical protein